MNLCFFGSLGDRIGREVELDLGPDVRTIGEVRQELSLRYPQCAEDLLSPKVRACLNDAIARDDQLVTGADRLDFLPPLSGG